MSITCEKLAQELIDQAQKKSERTYRSVEGTFRLHILPFLREHAPLAENLSNAIWLKYKAEKSHMALFNHHKHFRSLCRYAFDLGHLPRPVRLDWVRSREDRPESGKVMSDEEFERLLKHLSPTWRERAIIQRYTGMRPSEVRTLTKDSVDFTKGVITLSPHVTKTRKGRSFKVPSQVLRALQRAKLRSGYSPYLFPKKGEPGAPMSASLLSWHEAQKKAGLEGYTPHDLRHTYLTEMFKKGYAPALICYQAGLDMRVAQKTYLHYDADDTVALLG